MKTWLDWLKLNQINQIVHDRIFVYKPYMNWKGFYKRPLGDHRNQQSCNKNGYSARTLLYQTTYTYIYNVDQSWKTNDVSKKCYQVFTRLYLFLTCRYCFNRVTYRSFIHITYLHIKWTITTMYRDNNNNNNDVRFPTSNLINRIYTISNCLSS